MSLLGYKQAPGSKTWKTIPELTLEQVDNTTKPQENGQNDGSRNYPGVEIMQPAETETRIVYEVENYLKSVDDMANKEFTDMARQIDSLNLADKEDDFSDLKMGAEKEFNQYAINALPELKKLRVAERQELRNLNLFKVRNKLERLASYPDSRLLHISLIGLALVFECLLNMHFFAEGSKLGYLGGFFEAFIISICNISLAFAIGRLGLSNLHHVKNSRKAAAAIGTTALLVLITFFHLLVGHYRDILSTDPDNVIHNTLGKFYAGPISFDSLDSITVMIIGGIIAIIALSKGYKFDDVYPGYGDADRKYKEKLNAYEDKEANLREKMASSIAHAEEKIADRLKGYEAKEKNITDLCNGASSVVKHFDNIYQQVDEISNVCITSYREANMRIRTEEKPQSFNFMPQIKRLLNKDQHTKQLDNFFIARDRSSGQLKTIRDNAATMLAELHKETEMMGDKIDKLADEVDKKADKELKRIQEV